MPLEEAREMPIADARKMGAMALFGEKYGDKVRVVKYGSSVELCGGTHVPNTGNIGMLRIVSESSIAAGIRRIEAVTGEGVEKIIDDIKDTMSAMAGMLGNASDIKTAVERAINENASLKKQVDDFFKERVQSVIKTLVENVREVNGIKVMELIGIRIPELVKDVAFGIRAASPEHTIFVAATVYEGKPLLTIALSDDIVKEGYNAGKIIREAAKKIKGGGGGQPFFAQAGGKDSEGLSAARDAILAALPLA